MVEDAEAPTRPASSSQAAVSDTTAPMLAEAHGSSETARDKTHSVPQPKKIHSLNINQKFFQSAKAATTPKQEPVKAPTPPIDERTTSSPRLVTAMPGRPGVATSAPTRSSSHDAARKETPRETASAPRMPWSSVKTTAPSRPIVSSHDFPTAKEVMEAQRKAEERAAAHAAEEHAKQQVAHKELERFRGTDLGTGDHWDEMGDESEDSLDDVVEFGDGKQYKISEVEEEVLHTKPPPAPPRVPAWGPTSRLPWQSEPPRTTCEEPVRAPAVASWGPLAQRHSTLTGKPVASQPAPTSETRMEQGEAIAEEQHHEMVTAAERARKRREEDERAREQERQRAREKAAQIEEQMRAAEQAKKEAEERANQAQREREQAREHERLEARERERQAREEHARQRLEREERERREREAKAEALVREREQRQKEADKLRALDEQATWRRTTPLPKSLRTPKPKHTSPRPAVLLGPPEPPMSCAIWEQDDAPVWRKYTVHLPSVPHTPRAPTRAAQQRTQPRTSATLACTWAAPCPLAMDDSPVAFLHPADTPVVRLPSTSTSTSMPPPPPSSALAWAPSDEHSVWQAWTAHVDRSPTHALFSDDVAFSVASGSGTPCRRRAPRVHLPSAPTWRRRPRTYDTLLDRSMPTNDMAPWPPTSSSLAFPLLSTTTPLQDRVEAPSTLADVWRPPSTAAEGLPSTTTLPRRPVPGGALDVYASPFRPGGPIAEVRPDWHYRSSGGGSGSGTAVAAAAAAAPPRLHASTRPLPRDPEQQYMLPADYSDFALSDAW